MARASDICDVFASNTTARILQSKIIGNILRDDSRLCTGSSRFIVLAGILGTHDHIPAHNPQITMLTIKNVQTATVPRSQSDKHSLLITATMASFMNTMLVQTSPPQPYSSPGKPLPALHSNILAESESYLHLPCPQNPEDCYSSPIQKHFQDLLSEKTHPASPAAGRGYSPPPSRVSERMHELQRHNQHRGLGHGLSEIGLQADLLTRSNSNARARNQTAFQPQKRAKGTNSWQLKQFAEATLGSGSLRKVVQLPEGEDRDEWLAVNGVYPQLPLSR